MEYEDLEQRFSTIMLQSATGKDIDFNKMQKGFAGLVTSLHQAYKEGLVESVDGIPSADEVLGLDDLTFKRLYFDIIQRFFPMTIGPRTEYNIESKK